ncbi:elongation factor G [bacterium]|nr:elongation factor G [bacterium]
MVGELSGPAIRNIGFIAHIDAGKTTTTERVLFFTGKTHKIGEVDYGTTQMDWMDQERERGITIQSAVTTTYYKEHQINIIDTPGHVDFTLEVEKAIRVLDGLVVIFDGVAGVQPQSETVWHQADKFNVPRLVCINKLDRAGADYVFAIDDIRKKFSVDPVAVNIPYYRDEKLYGVIDLFTRNLLHREDEGGELTATSELPDDIKDEVESRRKILIESVVENNEDLLALYLEGEEISQDDFKATFRDLVLSRKLIPVLTGSALKNVGILPLLDGIVDFLPSPADIASLNGVDPRNNERVNINPLEHNSFLGYVFKIMKDPFLDKLSFVRIYSGSLKRGQVIFNDVSRKKEKVLKIFQMHANSKKEIEEAFAGNFVGIAGLKFSKTADTLSTPDFPLVLDVIEVPKPVISLAIEPRSNKDYDKLISILEDYRFEDPSFAFRESEETGQLIIYGMGELHLEIILDRLFREAKIDVKSGKPRVSFRESISEAVYGIRGKVANEMGSAEIIIDLEPLEDNDKNRVEMSLKKLNDKFHRTFVRELQEAAENLLSVGVLSGYPLMGVKLIIRELVTGSENLNVTLYKMALSNGVMNGLQRGNPVMLEPYMKFELYAPEEYFGDVFNSINSKGATVRDVIPKGALKIIKGAIPLSKMFKYTTELRSLTQGRGNINLEFMEFRPLPPGEQKELLQGYSF